MFFCVEEVRQEFQPITLLYTVPLFDKKGTPFVNLLLKNGTPLRTLLANNKSTFNELKWRKVGMFEIFWLKALNGWFSYQLTLLRTSTS